MAVLWPRRVAVGWVAVAPVVLVALMVRGRVHPIAAGTIPGMSDATPDPDADPREVVGAGEASPEVARVEFVTVGLPRPGGWAAVNDAGQPRDLPADALVDLRTVHPGQRLRTEVSGTQILRAEIP